MERYAVIGLQFGDEGKGLFTDYLASNDCLVARFSGGQQAGHTVVTETDRHVFSNFGSGTLKGARTYWSEHCTFFPINFVGEYKQLEALGYEPEIYINRKCPVTTLYDAYHNRTDEKNVKDGTCGLGVGATFERESKFYSLLYEDLFNQPVLDIKFKMIQSYYGMDDIGHEEFFDAIEFIKSKKNIQMVDYDMLDRKVYLQYNTIVYEGSQGLLLDQHIGFFPHVTRADTGTKNIKDNVDEVFYITRAYQTRHGNGPMLNESVKYNINDNPDETNVTNENQGAFRKAMLNVNLLQYAIDKDNFNGVKHLGITCLDHLNSFDYIHDDEIVKCQSKTDFVSQVAGLLGITSIYTSETPDSKNIKKFL